MLTIASICTHISLLLQCFRYLITCSSRLQITCQLCLHCVGTLPINAVITAGCLIYWCLWSGDTARFSISFHRSCVIIKLENETTSPSMSALSPRPSSVLENQPDFSSKPSEFFFIRRSTIFPNIFCHFATFT